MERLKEDLLALEGAVPYLDEDEFVQRLDAIVRPQWHRATDEHRNQLLTVLALWKGRHA